MPDAARIALVYAALRGLLLAAGTVPWLLRGLRRAEATEPERSLLVMVASRAILLGLALLVLWLTGRREALAWTLLGDGALQLLDALLAVTRRKGALAVLPAVLCALDGWAGLTLLG